MFGINWERNDARGKCPEAEKAATLVTRSDREYRNDPDNVSLARISVKTCSTVTCVYANWPGNANKRDTYVDPERPLPSPSQ